MKIVTTLAIALVVGLLAIVGYAYSGLYDISASSPHTSLVTWLLSTTSDASIKRYAKRVDVPNLEDEALALAGIGDFDSMCTGCHGAPGKDPEALGQGLNPAAPDLTESAEELTAAELFWVAKNGIKMTGMPAWGKTHGDDELWPVIAFLTKLPELDSAAYEAMLAKAAGMGFSSNDEPVGTKSYDDQSFADFTLENPESDSRHREKDAR